MPTTFIDYAPRTIGEKVIFSLDYLQNLGSSETIISAAWSISLVSGTDPGVAGRISGSPAISGSVVSQLVDLTSGMSSGARYLLKCAATTSLGEVLIGYSHFNILQAT